MAIVSAGCVLLLAACGGSDNGDDASSTTSSTTTSAPTTTLAAGETDTLAAITSDPPAGYSFVDAPAGLVDEVSGALASDPEAASAITGSSAHSVVNDASGESVGVLMLIEIAPEYAALPGFADGLASGFGEGGQATEVGGTEWTKYDDGQGTVTYLSFTPGEGGSGVMVVVIGTDATAIEAFLSVARP